MKRIISLVMLLSFVTVQANASTLNSLKLAYDELNYSLSVEWDQKDKEFYKEATKTFQEKIAELQKSGLSNEELVQFAKSTIKNENVKKDFETALNLVKVNLLSVEEARNLIVKTLEKSYSEGASWSSGGVIILSTVLLLVVVAAAVAGGVSTTRTPTTGGGVYVPYCYDSYYCYDYYDAWGYYWYSDCYWQTYCY